ncbi:hypothetical protein KUTeg_005816 [Tegillarca granosa]|uniref:FAD dependent oxidoreductase domain-containing protein n=1 Tax=Tegillarca granosa TaxID=220873 RepID=A0ABQ9FJ95_TEGGR|nr:hypothetical protein KUTeg_016724 [Tegillarca granosa]KAJ8316622.1 hypothetical protein KUTeg_005816 [Tegillarca granosa]
MKKKVCVIGAGVIGLSTAVCIQDRVPSAAVTLIAETFSPNTTSDGSAGFWEPFYPSPIQKDLYRKWGEETFNHLKRVAHSTEGGANGVHFVSGYLMSRNENSPKDPQWKKDLVIGYRKLTEQDMELHPQYKEGAFYTTIIADQTPYLSWLFRRFRGKGGKVVSLKVNSLMEVTGTYDVVVNCTGLGAREAKSVTLGGSGHVNSWDLNVIKEDKERIFHNCCKLIPSLKNAKILYDWVGLRPARSEVRLELDDRNFQKCKVIHNYGHGGSGVTLHWGCALDAANLVHKALFTPSIKSKL